MNSNLTGNTAICENIINYITAVNKGVLDYDARLFNYEWDPIENLVADYLNNNAKKDELYSAIHIDKSTKSPKYDANSADVANAY